MVFKVLFYFFKSILGLSFSDGLANLEADAYKALNVEQTYSTMLSNQKEIELLPGGFDMVVQCEDRTKYSEMVRKARMLENIEQVIINSSF